LQEAVQTIEFDRADSDVIAERWTSLGLESERLHSAVRQALEDRERIVRKGVAIPVTVSSAIASLRGIDRELVDLRERVRVRSEAELDALSNRIAEMQTELQQLSERAR
jgi:prefoldin subunit 5